ncbi:MAG: hypothetical protein ACLUDU_00430 [Butyricimonas faecihominis]
MSKEWASRWRKPGGEEFTDVPRLEANELMMPFSIYRQMERV